MRYEAIKESYEELMLRLSTFIFGMWGFFFLLSFLGLCFFILELYGRIVRRCFSLWQALDV